MATPHQPAPRRPSAPNTMPALAALADAPRAASPTASLVRFARHAQRDSHSSLARTSHIASRSPSPAASLASSRVSAAASATTRQTLFAQPRRSFEDRAASPPPPATVSPAPVPTDPLAARAADILVAWRQRRLLDDDWLPLIDDPGALAARARDLGALIAQVRDVLQDLDLREPAAAVDGAKKRWSVLSATGAGAPGRPAEQRAKLMGALLDMEVDVATCHQLVQNDPNELLQEILDEQDEPNGTAAAPPVTAPPPDHDDATASPADALPAESSDIDEPVVVPVHHKTLSTEPLLWHELSLLNEIYRARDLGVPTCLCAAGDLLVLGTTRGLVGVFTRHQQLRHVLGWVKPAGPDQLQPVTAIDVSQSGQFLVVGHANALICIWSLDQGTLVKKIRPVPPPPARDGLTARVAPKAKHHGHRYGTKICHVKFVGKSNRRFVSADELGVAFYHVLSNQFLSSTETLRLFGSYDNRLNQSRLTTIFAVETFDRFVAVITPFKMVILDTQPTIRTVYRRLRIDTGAPEIGQAAVSGCIEVLPDARALVFSWSSWLCELNLDIDTETRALTTRVEHESDVPTPVFAIKSFLGASYLILLTDQQTAAFYSLSEHRIIESAHVTPIVGRDDILAVSQNLGDRGEISYAQALAVPASDDDQVYALGPVGVLRGDLVPPEERLLAYARLGMTATAIHFALNLYHGGAARSYVSDPTVAAVTIDPDHARDLAYCASLQCVRSTKDPDADVPQLMHLLLALGGDAFLAGQFMETVLECGAADVFFRHVLVLLRTREVARSSLPPSLVAAMLAHWAATEHDDEYVETLELVDPTAIDVDVAFKACRARRLPRGLLYLHHVLGDLDVGLDDVSATDLPSALAFVRDALPMHARYSADARDAMAGWVMRHLEALVVRVPAPVLVAVVSACIDHATRPQEFVAALTDLRRRVTGKCRALVNVVLVVQAQRHPHQVIIASADLHVILNQLMTMADENDDDGGARSGSDDDTEMDQLAAPIPADLIQDAMVHLARTLTLSPDQVAHLLAHCEHRGFWRVCEHIFLALRDYAHLLDCYLRDPTRALGVFAVVRQLLDTTRGDAATTAAVTARFLEVLPRVGALDADATAQLLVGPLATELSRALEVLTDPARTDPAVRLAVVTSLAQQVPTPLPEPVLRQCLADHAAQGHDATVVHLVAKHADQFSADLDAWRALCDTYNQIRAACLLLERQGRVADAVDRLVRAGDASAALAACRRHPDPAHWAHLVALLMAATPAAGSGAHDAAVAVALDGVQDVPAVLARVVTSMPAGIQLAPSLTRHLCAGLAAARAAAAVNAATRDVVDAERVAAVADARATAPPKIVWRVPVVGALCSACGLRVRGADEHHALLQVLIRKDDDEDEFE
ncbi:Vacuolar protein sorting-associated protein 8 [Allomyces arbusculus]|nr:Vacuolar protein sorting-associated protein 8 [Allomyces arbusculus]